MRTALCVIYCLWLPFSAAAQPPQLNRSQRDMLRAVIEAVDAAADQAEEPGVAWPVHVLRASDGSHYVAFSVEPPDAAPLPAGPVLLYVRLATRAIASAQPERSALHEWLVGRRTDPRLLPGRGIAMGEMPAFGAGSIAVRGSTASTGSTDLKLMALERERERQAQEERDKQRRNELEGKTSAVRSLLPFEDFDVAAESSNAGGARTIARALTAGPGEYDLFVAWADQSAPRPANSVRILKRSLRLPAASATDLSVSSVILADDVAVRPAPHPPSAQASHPYSIGTTEITPARDAVYTSDERLAVAFQVINARPTDSGKPDIAVGFRVVRMAAGREQAVASLNPQYYDQSTMPLDFDLRLGHPIFVAMAAPLASLTRGLYRLKITVNDRVTGRSMVTDADFEVAATMASLLAEAPSLGRPFRRDEVVAPARLQPILDALRPASPSPALARALDIAQAGRLIDLLVEEPVPAEEAGVRLALTGLALHSVGDPSAVIQLQRALQLNAPAAPIQYLIGSTRAMQTRDPDAITAWRAAVETGLAPEIVHPLLVDAYLRQGDGARAAATVDAALGGRVPAPDSPWISAYAATRIATGRAREALQALDQPLVRLPDSGQESWLRLHALFAVIVGGGSPAERERFVTLANDYAQAGGPHADLARDWMNAIAATSSAS